MIVEHNGASKVCSSRRRREGMISEWWRAASQSAESCAGEVNDVEAAVAAASGRNVSMAGGSKVGEVKVKADRLTALGRTICESDGSAADEARLVAEHLVMANLQGHDSHGIGTLPRYIENARGGA